MGHHGVRTILLLLAYSLAVSAQVPMELPARRVRVDIQMYLPGGQKPTRPIAFQVRSHDWRSNQLSYTTSTGWASFDVEEYQFASVLVPAEEGVYATTSLRFWASEGLVAIHLRPYPGTEGTVSVASLHQPDPKARKLYEKALKNLKKSRVAEAEKQLREAAALDPHYTAPVIRLGRLWLRQHRFEEAEELFRKALEVDARSAPALAGLGIALNARGHYHASLNPLQEAARLSDNAEVRLHLGVALMENGSFPEAERALLSVADGESGLAAGAYFALGRLYERQGDKHQGIRSFESFLALRPQGPAADLARESIRALRLMPQEPQ